MKINEWLKLLDKAYENQIMTCPECGGEVTARLFADESRVGCAFLKCSKCNVQQNFSRVKFPESVKLAIEKL